MPQGCAAAVLHLGVLLPHWLQELFSFPPPAAGGKDLLAGGVTTCIGLVQAVCVYWCQMPLQPTGKPCCDTVQSYSSQTLPGPQDRVFVWAWCGSLLSHVSPGARPQFMTCRVVQGLVAFALQPQPGQDPNPTIPCRRSGTDAENTVRHCHWPRFRETRHTLFRSEKSFIFHILLYKVL